MFHQINFVRTIELREQSEVTIKLPYNLEFTVYRDVIVHKIKNTKGNFEITKITEIHGIGGMELGVLNYDKISSEFKGTDRLGIKTLTFCITAMVEKKEMNEMKQMCAVKYQLQIPSARLQSLKCNQSFKDEFVLPGYDGLIFTYYVNKIETTGRKNKIILHIQNPYDVEIRGKKGDFNIAFDSTKSIDLHLLFNFYTDEISNDGKTKYQSNVLGSPQHPSSEGSRPESVIPSFSSKVTTLLHKLATNNQFADVYFISSDGEKIPSYRNILAASSDIFAAIFEESTEIPIQITADDFDAKTIQSALNYLYDKSDSINGKETHVFKFAVKFGIHDLIDACVSFFKDSVDSTNVCEFIQIAYSNNFEDLKQKCLKILVQKKEEIDSAKVAELPKNILFDAFCFKL
uniref:BTB domain-containing protein n=1 Tax=Panagrolaimus davidi TaxID=227884 RepID=A0A914R560_9BILA